MWSLLLLCGCGIAHDALYALFIRFLNDKRVLLASFVSFLITLMSYGVFAAVLDQLMTGSYSKIVAYSVGAGLGTAIGMLTRREKKEKDRAPT